MTEKEIKKWRETFYQKEKERLRAIIDSKILFTHIIKLFK